MVQVAEFLTRVGAVDDSAVATVAPESDFSVRKMRTAFVCLLGMTFATSILPYTALGYALKPMTAEFHWTREQFGFGYSYLMWSGALTVWAMGFITDKLGARWVIIPGTVFVGLVTLALARIQHHWQFYLLLALLGVFGSSGASYSKVVVALFTQNRGKAMALFGAEGVGVRALIPAVTSVLILHYGWRGMFDAFGIVILLFAPVLALGLDEPGAPGRWPSLRPRRPGGAEAAAPPPRMVFEGMTMGAVLRDGVFWLMLVATLTSAVVSGGITPNVVAALEDRGFGQDVIAQLMSVTTLFGLAGAVAAGWLVDRFPTAKIAAPFSLIAGLGYFLLMTVTPDRGGKPVLLLGLGLGVFAFSAYLPMAGYFLTRFFGLRSFATISGFQAFVQAICMGLAAPLVGRVYDLDRNYDHAFEVGILATLVTAAVFLLLPAYRFPADIGMTPAGGRRA